jgi:hypothetical protein
MALQVRNLPPALKHAAFCANALLPGEDAGAFEALHSGLVAEHAPVGPTEHDVVASLARLIWRKQHLGTFRIADVARRHCNSRLTTNIMRKHFPEQFEEDGTDKKEVEDRSVLGESYVLVEMGAGATLKELTAYLVVEERLDSLIDRCFKRLLFIRGLKSLPAASSARPAPLQVAPSPAIAPVS